MKGEAVLETYEIFQLIARGKRKLLAQMLHKTSDLICKWGREPVSDDNPTGTGEPNPLDSLAIIITFSHAHCPALAAAIEEWIHQQNAAFYRTYHGAIGVTHEERLGQVRRTLQEISDVVEEIAVERRPKQLKKEIAEMLAELHRLQAMLDAETAGGKQETALASGAL